MATEPTPTESTEPTVMLARLKPYNEKKGYRARVYMIDGRRFLEEKGWYEVPEDLAKKLKDLHQNHYDEESPFLFDVATENQAQRIEQKEEEAIANARASARNPTKFKGKQRTQALPINNAGGLAGLPGDFTSDDLYKPIHGNAPAGPGAVSDPGSDGDDLARLNQLEGASGPDETDDEGRHMNVGRVSGPKQRTKTK